MKLTVDIKLDDKRLRRLPERFHAEASRLIRETAFAIQGKAQTSIAAIPLVDTGAMMNSIFVVTETRSTYAQATARATKDNPDVEMLPEPGRPPRLTAIVAVGAAYALFHEEGTARGIAARPFLRPAVEDMRREWEEGMNKLFEKATRS